MKATLAQLEKHIQEGVLEVLEIKAGELIIKTNCPDDNDTMLGLALCMVNEEGRIIIVGNEYDKLSEKSKKFTYYHEVAHHVNGDVIATNTVDNEVAADMYSACMVGKKAAYRALTELIDIVESYKAHTYERFSHIEAAKEVSLDQLKYRRGIIFKKLSTKEKVQVLLSK